MDVINEKVAQMPHPFNLGQHINELYHSVGVLEPAKCDIFFFLLAFSKMCVTKFLAPQSFGKVWALNRLCSIMLILIAVQGGPVEL